MVEDVVGNPAAKANAQHDQRQVNFRNTFLKWVASLLLGIVVLVSAPFTMGSFVAYGTDCVVSVWHGLGLHPVVEAMFAAGFAFALVAFLVYQIVGPGFHQLRPFWLLFSVLLFGWLLFLFNSPSFEVLVTIFQAAGGSPPWLIYGSVGFLMVVEFLPVFGVFGVVIAALMKC